jgi:membrane associated rhomboid family serine protease
MDVGMEAGPRDFLVVESGMFFPLSDDDRHLVKPAIVTWTLLVTNVLVFVFLQLPSEAFTMGWSTIPKEIATGSDLVGPHSIGGQFMEHAQGPSLIYLTLLSSMFMHGDWMHLGGNLLYLWIFGDNVEHRFGHVRFLLFYLLSGLCASALQISLGPESIIPNLGASGAISGVLGAYLVLFPRNKVNAIFFFRVISVPAVVVLGMWIALQIFQGASSFQNVGESGGVAYGAHIGGFVAGVVFGLLARAMMKEEPGSVLRNQYARDSSGRQYW